MKNPPIFSLKEVPKRRKEKQFKGDKVVCCICNATYREFGVFGKQNRQNAQCHNCGSLERHRLIWKYIQDKNLLEQTIRLLHFAPAKAFYESFSALENLEYHPCDLYPDLYKYGGKVKIHQVDITEIPFEDNHFDFILCNHVLEHIENDHLAMSELYRVMKPGGAGIFQVPLDYNREHTFEDFSITSKKGRLKAFGQKDHVRWYGQDYKERLAKMGFQVTEEDFVSSFSAEEQFKFGLDSKEKVYWCNKPK